MGAQVATQAVLLLLANLPTAISTATQVFAFVTHGIESLKEAVGDKQVTKEELLALVQRIVTQHATIAALD
ncbi:MAG: hypothetical protein GC190_20970 [Alphaproteobacteria bacterium]|nr:hypothetical protein [Alphaproteobacteria bacterium]